MVESTGKCLRSQLRGAHMYPLGVMIDYLAQHTQVQSFIVVTEEGLSEEVRSKYSFKLLLERN